MARTFAGSRVRIFERRMAMLLVLSDTDGSSAQARLALHPRSSQIHPRRSIAAGQLVDPHNVVGLIPGTSRRGNDDNENIVVTCYHDAPFASALEEASGLAVLLALAKEFGAAQDDRNEARRDLVFVERPAEGFLKRTAAAFGVEPVAEEVEPDGHGGYRLTGRPHRHRPGFARLRLQFSSRREPG